MVLNYGEPLLIQFTQDQYFAINEACSVMLTIFSLLGVVANIISIRTFIIIGLSDGVTYSFLALAVFDLAYLLVSCSMGVTLGFYVLELKYNILFPIETLGVKVYFCNILILTNVMNMLITTFLAVVRCMCIAKPLHFKNMFTRNKAIIIIKGFVVFTIVSYAPLLAEMKMAYKFDSVTNSSRPSLWLSPKRESVKVIVWCLLDFALPIATEIVVIICVIVMAKSLQAAARFRQASTTVSKENTTDKEVKVTSKDVRVVQQVVIISVIYVICNIPKILISIVTNIEDGFALGKKYGNLYLAVNSLGKHFEVFNASVNLIIYCKYNRKFRSVLGF